MGNLHEMKQPALQMTAVSASSVGHTSQHSDKQTAPYVQPAPLPIGHHPLGNLGQLEKKKGVQSALFLIC